MDDPSLPTLIASQVANPVESTQRIIVWGKALTRKLLPDPPPPPHLSQSNSPLSSLKVLVSDLVEFCANNAHRVALQSAEEIVEVDGSRPLLDVKYSEVKNVFHELIVKVAIENMQSVAQSDPNFQRRMASLYFFNELFKAVHNFNSFVPPTETRDPFVSASVLPLADYEQEKREVSKTLSQRSAGRIIMG